MLSERFQNVALKTKDGLLLSERLEKVRAPVLRELAKGGTEMIDIKDSERNIDKFYFLRQGRYPVVILNHLSLADVGVAVKIADLMNGIGNPHISFNMPVAISLNEKQGLFIKKFYDAVRPWVKDHRIEMFEVARYKDRKEHEYDPTTETNQQVHDTVYTNKGMIIFMEGEQAGGRTNKDTGMINGMIKVINTQVPKQIKSSIEFGREVAFLPVGIEGTHRLLNPNNGQITREALECMAYMRFFGADPKLSDATIGTPFTSSDIENAGVSLDDFSAVNTYLMRKIADILPDYARGVYA